MVKTAATLRRIAATLFFTALFAGMSHATVSVKVFSMDEGLAESNISKPRIYIQNTGTETINDFYYRYYFETENGKVPVLEEYYTPNATVQIASCGSGYYIQYSVTGANLTPGGLLPNSAGNVVGLHFNDWSNWDNNNDFSNNLSAVFAENQNIALFCNGTKIYGNIPGTTSGSVLREVWTGISGTSTDDIPVSTAPPVTGSQTGLDAQQSYGDNFGVRLRGYITAPATGDYTFWLASDDNGKLWLSTDDDPANKGNPIAFVPGWTSYQQWNKFLTEQKSAVKTLTAGNRYYIEVLYKEGVGGDNCSVGWLKPGQSGTVPSEIVPSSVLTPYVPAIIPAPPTLTATATGSNTINLSWNDVANEQGYKLFISTGGSGFTSLITLVAGNTSYQVTGLTPETAYRFKIQSYNGTGESDFSNAVLATTPAVIEGKATERSGMAFRGYPLLIFH
ncbi:MAG: fibronectin type III domain-containing protein [Chitinispirillaceae bacterium]|nr:fibronectin type III domain-containing protein [Chitinispirillaceae bacterium]